MKQDTACWPVSETAPPLPRGAQQHPLLWECSPPPCASLARALAWSLPMEANRLWWPGVTELKTKSRMGEAWLSCSAKPRVLVAAHALAASYDAGGRWCSPSGPCGAPNA